MQIADSPTEYTARYAKVVSSVQDAFVFVMSHMDRVGRDPQVIINPLHVHEHDEEGNTIDETRLFEVSVSGMVELDDVVQ